MACPLQALRNKPLIVPAPAGASLVRPIPVVVLESLCRDSSTTAPYLRNCFPAEDPRKKGKIAAPLFYPGSLFLYPAVALPLSPPRRGSGQGLASGCTTRGRWRAALGRASTAAPFEALLPVCFFSLLNPRIPWSFPPVSCSLF